MGKFLGLDVGRSRTGYAVSNPEQTIAFPRGFFLVAPKEKFIDAVCRLVKEESITKIVMGLPLDEENQETAWTQKIRLLGDEISQRTSVSVEYIDEFESTKEALAKIPLRKDRVKKKGYADAVSAQIILQRYLDMK